MLGSAKFVLWGFRVLNVGGWGLLAILSAVLTHCSLRLRRLGWCCVCLILFFNLLNFFIMDLLKSFKKYAGSWSVKEVVKFSEEELGEIKGAKVGYFSRDYPDKLQVCFLLKGNFKAYCTVSNDSELKAGDDVDMSTHKFLILEKEGEEDIKRFDAKKLSVEK